MVPRRQLAGTAASLAVAVGLVVGCSASEASQASGGTSPTPPSTSPSSSSSSTGAAVAAALQFTAPLVGGGEFDAAALAGSPVAFWFWAPT